MILAIRSYVSKGSVAMRKFAVIGSGVMGSGIAAHIANSGHEVFFLDIVPAELNGAKDRNALANSALQKMQQAKPAPLTCEKSLKRIKVGNLEDDFQLLSQMDWIIEVVIEDLSIKKNLYKKLEKIIKPGAVVSSNTSTIPLAKLVDGMSADFKSRFFITHFFNPPRYMRLCEIILGEVESKYVTEIINFIDVHLGKGVVRCKDTPGFIANRVGCFFLEVALNEAIERNLDIESIDYNVSKFFGTPKTGVFALWDLIGVDLMPLIAKSMISNLAQQDEFCKSYKLSSLVKKMIKQRLTGKKNQAGFYKKSSDGMLAIDLATGKYRPANQVTEVENLFEDQSELAQYLRSILARLVNYTCVIASEISGDFQSIDDAMKLGYGWKYGLFGLVDLLGAGNIAKLIKKPHILLSCNQKFYDHQQILQFDGSYRKLDQVVGKISIADFKQKRQVIFQNEYAAFLDLGDDVACLEIRTKLNMLSAPVFEAINNALEHTSKLFKTLVIGDDDAIFSAGGDLKYMLSCAQRGHLSELRSYIKLGQETMMAIKSAHFPVLLAMKGYAVGGGCEMMLHATNAAIHLETGVGLVESKVGLIPAWGGVKEMIRKSNQHGLAEMQRVFKNIMLGRRLSNAAEIKHEFLYERHFVTMNLDRVLGDTKKLALNVAAHYRQRRPAENIKGSVKIEKDFAMSLCDSEHDRLIAEELMNIFNANLTGISESALLEMELDGFLRLITTQKTQDRIIHMLESGKALKN